MTFRSLIYKPLLLLLLSLGSASAFSAIQVYEFESLEQEAQFKELIHTLRCPKCQNNTIGDSDAELAQDLRQKVYDMTVQGQSKDDVVDYMKARYGNFVTYDPPFTVSTAILWLGPIFILLTGFSLIILRSRKSASTTKGQEQWSNAKEQQLNALLEEQDDKKGEK
ncbi:cytochrome c-type biogenesis protein CcmH [Vibrio sp.]|nr:cytochrome c-type biogenesis protein CcmH [Vibrio sp.]